jgi:predicted ester cyclase
MSAEENKVLVRQFVAAADRLDFDQARACLSPEIVVHLAGAPAPLDFATFFKFGQMWHTAFPDEQTSFEEQVAEGDKVVSRMTSTATGIRPLRESAICCIVGKESALLDHVTASVCIPLDHC